MLDLFPEAEKPVEIVPARKLLAKVAALYLAPSDHFETRPVECHDGHHDTIFRTGGSCSSSSARRSSRPAVSANDSWLVTKCRRIASSCS